MVLMLRMGPWRDDHGFLKGRPAVLAWRSGNSRSLVRLIQDSYRLSLGSLNHQSSQRQGLVADIDVRFAVRESFCVAKDLCSSPNPL